MKKHLIAAAVAAAVAAPASAQVAVYGLLDMGYTDIKTDNTARSGGAVTSIKAVQTGNQGRLSGSRLGFRGTEDLGGGLKASFVFETGIDAGEQANGIGNGTRLGFVDLSGGFGAVTLGRQVSSTKFVNDTFAANGNPNISTGYVAGAGLSSSSTIQTTGGYAASSNASTQGGLGNANAGERISNLIRYTTPNLSGVTGTVGYYKTNTSTATTAATIIGDANGKGTDFGLRYSAGKLALAVGVNNYETVQSTANDFSVDNQHVAYGASYDFGAARVYIHRNDREYETSTAGSKIDFEDTTVGIQVPMGSITFMAIYSDGDDSSTTQNTDKKGYQLGLIYNLSKRTNIYGVYGNGEAKSETLGTTTNKKVEESAFAIGVRHSF